ncbi:hypothetical protein G6F50_018186 [Rhizopus delemar]|uniref:Uncharacterized protein n=1 Tax=Rhizopus delemar TaxID=936053 RepID=A0A9P6XNZ0_9FUNG|nr:hypothetical protein G6F50_018186 [Rhizopus delemar]
MDPPGCRAVWRRAVPCGAGPVRRTWVRSGPPALARRRRPRAARPACPSGGWTPSGNVPTGPAPDARGCGRRSPVAARASTRRCADLGAGR